MDYNLAKELKDAGFPQTRDDGALKGSYLFPENVSLADKKIHEKAVFAPTLEELIVACGKPFMALCRNDDDSGWTAFKNGDTIMDKHLCVAEAPTEAVARLWLALQKAKAG